MRLGPTTLLAVAVVASAFAAPANAQHHHHHSGDGEATMAESSGSEADVLHMHVALSVESGDVEAFASTVSYMGAALMVGAQRGRLEAMAHIPYYRIELGGRHGTGLGDIHVEGRYVITRRGPIEAGVSAGFMPPFGNDDDGIAMGHAMLMAGGFARYNAGRAQLSATLGYGGALGSGGHAEHGVDVWPPVNPMNAHELKLAPQLGIDIAAGFGLQGSVSLAQPLGDGDQLVLIGAGLSYARDRFNVSAGARHGFAGHTADLIFSSSAGFGF